MIDGIGLLPAAFVSLIVVYKWSEVEKMAFTGHLERNFAEYPVLRKYPFKRGAE